MKIQTKIVKEIEIIISLKEAETIEKVFGMLCNIDATKYGLTVGTSYDIWEALNKVIEKANMELTNEKD